jgi:hypothetical protein
MLEIMAAGCLLIATWCWWRSLRAIVRGRLSHSWPTARGVIRTARIAKKFNARAREVWRHDLEYSYAVHGKAYRGVRVQFGIPKSLLWFEPSDPSFQQYRRGARVAVYHSPSRPSVCALRPGVSPFAAITIAAGVVFAWMGFRLLTLPG